MQLDKICIAALESGADEVDARRQADSPPSLDSRLKLSGVSATCRQGNAWRTP